MIDTKDDPRDLSVSLSAIISPITNLSGNKPEATNPGSPGTAPGLQRSPTICGDLDMRIARDGTWFYHGSPIGRKPLVQLFAKVLRREDDGEFYLVTPVEKGRVAVDDAPFVAVELRRTGEGRGQNLVFRTNIDDEVPVDNQHPIRVEFDAASGEPSPYVRVRGGLDALIARAVYYELVELGEESADNPGHFGVWSGGDFHVIGLL